MVPSAAARRLNHPAGTMATGPVAVVPPRTPERPRGTRGYSAARTVSATTLLSKALRPSVRVYSRLLVTPHHV